MCVNSRWRKKYFWWSRFYNSSSSHVYFVLCLEYSLSMGMLFHFKVCLPVVRAPFLQSATGISTWGTTPSFCSQRWMGTECFGSWTQKETWNPCIRTMTSWASSWALRLSIPYHEMTSRLNISKNQVHVTWLYVVIEMIIFLD